jgi:hypothetical protein
MDWNDYVRNYNNSEAFWNITKQRAITSDTIEQFRDALKVLNQPKYRNYWNENQGEYSSELYRRGLILFFKTPTNVTRYMVDFQKAANDPIAFSNVVSKAYKELASIGGASGANGRIIKSLAEHLGLIYDMEGRLIFTPAGKEFLDSSSVSELVTVIRNQLMKWMYWNPSIRQPSHKAIALFPLRFTIRVCDAFQDRQISSEEYALFLASAQKMSQWKDVVEQIDSYRSLSFNEKEKLKNRMQAKFETIRGYASYVFSAFELTGLFEYERHGTLKLKPPSKLLNFILSDKTPYFSYDDEQLYYSYFGASGFLHPHRYVSVKVTNSTGKQLSFALIQILDSIKRYHGLIRGEGKVALPSRPTVLQVIDFKLGPLRVNTTKLVKPDANDVTLVLSGSQRTAALNYEQTRKQLDEFLASRVYDPELESLVKLKEKLTGIPSELKNTRGGRLEQLVYSCLFTMGSAYFDSVQWGGHIDEYGVPQHVGGYKHDISVQKDGTLIIIELTLAGAIIGQWKDVSCIDHLDKAKSGLLSFTGISDTFALFIDAHDLHKLTLERFAQDKTRTVCPLTITEFLKILDIYYKRKNFGEFVKDLKSEYGRRK